MGHEIWQRTHEDLAYDPPETICKFCGGNVNKCMTWHPNEHCMHVTRPPYYGGSFAVAIVCGVTCMLLFAFMAVNLVTQP